MFEKNTASAENPFVVSITSLAVLKNRPLRITGGAIVFCLSGRAVLSIDLQEYELIEDVEVILIPDSTLMLVQADEAFQVILFSFSRPLFDEAHYRLDAPFIHYLKNHPVYRHLPETALLTRKLFDVILAHDADKENRFRTIIIANFLRNILLNIYDKVQRNFTREKARGYSRKEELFHRFIELVIENCTCHRDVEFYTGMLCISKSYLASISRSVTRETPKAIIDKHIVKEIKILLAFSDIPLQQIADKLHFPDQSYLGRYFKHHTGQTLLFYRSQAGAI